MLHDRSSLYERLMQRKKDSFFLNLLFQFFEYTTLVAFAFLHVSPGKWTFRTPVIYTGTAAIWAWIFAWSSWGFWIIDTLNRIEFLKTWFKNGAEFIYHQIPVWLWILAVLIPVAFIVQHLLLAGKIKERDDIYNGYPWLLAVFRLITIRHPQADEKEESFFKEWVEPLFVFGLSLVWIQRPLFMWIGIIMAISLLSRERMLKHFYEVNQVNVQDVITRAESIAKGAGMKLANKAKKTPKVGRISPGLSNPRASSTADQSTH